MFFQRLIVWCPCSFVVSLVINQQSKHVAGNVYVIYSLFLAFLFVQQPLFHSFCGESSVFFFMKASMVYLLKEQAPLSNESSYHHMCVADENLTSREPLSWPITNLQLCYSCFHMPTPFLSICFPVGFFLSHWEDSPLFWLYGPGDEARVIFVFNVGILCWRAWISIMRC